MAIAWLTFLIAAGGQLDLSGHEAVDLTHSFGEETLYWPTASTFEHKKVFVGTTDKGFHYEAFEFCAAEHGGTHLDAPRHFAEGGWTADEIPLSSLMGPGVRVDVFEKAAKDRDYLVTTADFQAWEAVNGRLPAGAMVLIDTGSSRFWPDPIRYLGTAERGEAAVAKLHFPGLHPDAAAWLVKERGIKAVGIDTPSIDFGQSKYFKTHQVLGGANVPIFENLANLTTLPAKGAWIIALPMKIGGGSGGPLRILALLP